MENFHIFGKIFQEFILKLAYGVVTTASFKIYRILFYFQFKQNKMHVNKRYLPVLSESFKGKFLFLKLR